MTRKPLQAALMATPDETEAQFYEALQQGDLDRLMAVWADDDDVACVHPGGPRLIGEHAVRAGFEALCAAGGVPVRLAQARRVVVGNCAIHHVVEEVRITAAEGTQTGWVIATNAYVKTPQGWRMMLHHASPGTTRALQDVSDEPSTLH